VKLAPTIVWFRRDLRVADNPALLAAIQRGGPVVPVYIWAPEEEGSGAPGGAQRWWLHQSLTALGAELARLGSLLIVRQGSSLAVLRLLVEATGAQAIHWNRLYEPTTTPRDMAIKEHFLALKIEAKSHAAALLFEPSVIRNKSDKPFQVFSPFWKHLLTLGEPREPFPAPTSLPPCPSNIPSVPISDLSLPPKIDWAASIQAVWQPGEVGGAQMLAQFADGIADGYAETRNRPDVRGTSRLSPYLHFGEVSPHQVWHTLRRYEQQADATPLRRAGVASYMREIGWREFNHHLLFHFPHTLEKPLRPEFAAFPFEPDSALLKAWQRGRTGYPIVDAGMRELYATGWMHNRVRMIVASVLVKHLLQPWQAGAAWFWDTLLDADLANNTAGWQWSAGCGADAAPYFRIFNPMTQAEGFDPNGDYIRKWVPELANLTAPDIFAPWEAKEHALARAGVRLGSTYPEPIISHPDGRARALNAYEKIKKAKAVSA